MSATTKPPFELIGGDVSQFPAAATVSAPPADKDQTQVARQLLITALRALSQRTITAITNLFSLILVTLTFVLFGRILDDPTPFKLAGVGGFAMFCLLIDIVRRRAK